MNCHFCNGFYSPSYGEPVCVVCHTFLFPDFVQTRHVFFETEDETDDGDSGNDEPTDSYYSAEGRDDIYDVDQELIPIGVKNPPPANIAPLPTIEEQLESLSSIVPFRNYFNNNNPLDNNNIPNSAISRTTNNSRTEYISDINRFPPEVMILIFSYLDELSLWSVGNVCQQWRNLLDLYMHPSNWAKYTVRRWPLFKPFNKVDDWFETYTNMIRSSCCLACIRQMAIHKPPQEENHWRRNRLRSELKLMRTDPPEGIRALPLDVMCSHWQATIKGPTGSPYEGGLFYLYIQVPYSYPMSPPVVRFLTKVYHPNISRHGDIGIDAIHHNWSLALTICKVLISIQSLLTDPYCEISMEPDIANLYMTNRTKYDERARSWTWKYAMNEFYISSRKHC